MREGEPLPGAGRRLSDELIFLPCIYKLKAVYQILDAVSIWCKETRTLSQAGSIDDVRKSEAVGGRSVQQAKVILIIARNRSAGH
jgi:hypothetical protein